MLTVDFRLKYRRKQPTEQQLQGEKQREHEILKRTRGLAIGLAIPFTLASGPLMGWLVGAWLDKLLGTSYWLIVLILAGTIGSLKLTIDMLVRLERT